MKRTAVVLLLMLCAFAAYGFWPLGDPTLEIRFDPDAIRATREFLARPPVPNPKRPPNVLLILADDLGKHETTLYRPSSAAPTPNLERLAADGVVFTQGYVTSPVCSPSRAGLMTGRYQQRYGFDLLTHDRYAHNRIERFVARHFFSSHGWFVREGEPRIPVQRDIDRQGVPPTELTLAEILKKQGYATGIFGKWHLGSGQEMIPERRGFDTQYGFHEAFSLYADPDDPNFVGARDDYFADRYQWRYGRSGNAAIRRNGVVIDEPRYLTDAIAAEAIAWIEAHKDRPFFAYVPFNAPHAPLQAPRAYADRFANEPREERRVYLGMIAALDDAVGRILDALARAGVADNTLVVFASDNGAATYTGIADNTPLNGGKFMNYAGGVNVPFAARWPGMIPSGATYSQPISTLDAFMTIVRAAGAELPSDRPYDGVDLLPYLRGDATGMPHEALFWRADNSRGVLAGHYKLITDQRTGTRILFDLAADPGEKSDLSAAEPSRVDELEQKLRVWESQMVAPRWPSVMEYRYRIDGHDFIFPL